MKTGLSSQQSHRQRGFAMPQLLENGFGAHRIEGIGDKHVP
jgi:hypothetical protein